MSNFTQAPSFGYPHAELTKIEGKPDYLSLEKLKSEVYTNAVSVTSLRGNGQLGHAVIVLGAAEYNRIANLGAGGGNAFNWTPIAHPGNAPVIPNNATVQQSQNIRDLFDRQMKEFLTYNQVESDIKRQLLAAVDNQYVCSLAHRQYGYANVTARQIIEHLDNVYGALDSDALAENRKMLTEPWEPTESMEPFWNRISSIQAVAEAGGVPITDADVLVAARSVLQNSGVFKLDLREWDRRPAVQQTYANFKTFMTEANKTRIKETTADQLHHALAATTLRAGSPGTRFSPITIDSSVSGDGTVSLAYCWTHGLGPNANHNSKTCTKKARGHQEDATVDNMMGGNNTIRRKRGEKDKFRALNPPTPRNNRNDRDNRNQANQVTEADDDTVTTANSSQPNGATVPIQD